MSAMIALRNVGKLSHQNCTDPLPSGALACRIIRQRLEQQMIVSKVVECEADLPVMKLQQITPSSETH